MSIWEADHLARRRRLRLTESLSEWVDRAFARTPLREAPFNFAVAVEATRLRLPHSDLGDLFLAATAAVYDLTLVTADTQLLACSWLRTLPNE